jgi:hypothetical protein
MPETPIRNVERPVFVADDGRRARRLTAAVRALAGLVAVWVVGLAAGSVGFARLPPIHAGAVPGVAAASRPVAFRRARDVDTPRRCAAVRRSVRASSSSCRSVAV